MGGSDQCFFDAVVAVDVLTVNNNDMKLVEQELYICTICKDKLIVSIILRKLKNKLDRDY